MGKTEQNGRFFVVPAEKTDFRIRRLSSSRWKLPLIITALSRRNSESVTARKAEKKEKKILAAQRGQPRGSLIEVASHQEKDLVEIVESSSITGGRKPRQNKFMKNQTSPRPHSWAPCTTTERIRIEIQSNLDTANNKTSSSPKLNSVTSTSRFSHSTNNTPMRSSKRGSRRKMLRKNAQISPLQISPPHEGT
eukprot:Awhi_evm1s5622